MLVLCNKISYFLGARTRTNSVFLGALCSLVSRIPLVQMLTAQGLSRYLQLIKMSEDPCWIRPKKHLGLLWWWGGMFET